MRWKGRSEVARRDEREISAMFCTLYKGVRIYGCDVLWLWESDQEDEIRNNRREE